MWDRDLVSRLSAKASQVLLSLLLSGSHSVTQSSAEFAKTTGLGQRSIAPALLELRDAGLIQIIAQPGKPLVVSLVHPEEYGYETTVVEAGTEALEPAMGPKLLDTDTGITHDNTSGDVAGKGNTGGPDALIEACRMADERQDKGLRVAALQDVWDLAFPYADYPSQRLTNDAAKRLLNSGPVNRSAEWVGRVILESAQHATQRIQSPRAYIEAALANEDKRSAQPKVGEGSAITDDLRKLAQLGKEQFHAKDQDSR